MLGHHSYFCLIAMFFASAGSPAGAADDDGCGTHVRAEDAAVALYLQRVGAYELRRPEPRFVPEVPLTIHVVRNTNGSGAGLSQGEIDETIADANTAWETGGIRFYQRGATRFIDDDGLIHIDSEIELEVLRATDNIANTVNIYFVDEIDLWFTDLQCAISTFSWEPLQGIVFKKECTARGNQRATMAHELGHYFDLHHTHSTLFGEECPDGSNCASAGDQLCDTPADPNCRETVDRETCLYTGTEERCGDPFDPDVENCMSYAGRCRNRFSPGQRQRALATLFNIRTGLFDLGNPGVVWVDFGYSGDSDGTYARPWSSLEEGLANVSEGGRVVCRPGRSGETMNIRQRVILDAFGGAAEIGD